MKMNITDRECHHIVLNKMHFRCIQYETEKAVLLLGDHKPIDPKDMFAVPCNAEQSFFQQTVARYMKKLEDQALARGKRCVLADAEPRANGAIFYGEVFVAPNGERTYTASFAESVEALMKEL